MIVMKISSNIDDNLHFDFFCHRRIFFPTPLFAEGKKIIWELASKVDLKIRIVGFGCRPTDVRLLFVTFLFLHKSFYIQFSSKIIFDI